MQANPEDIGIIVLAAGQSERYGGDKRVALLPDGRSLLGATLAQVPDSLTRRVLVLHPGDEALAGRLAPDWEIVIAEDAVQGMGNSLASGVRAVCPWTCSWDCDWQSDWQGALIALGDMPFITAQTYQQAQQALCEYPLVLPHYQGVRGHPVGFGRQHFEALMRLQGDQGAQEIVKAHADTAHHLDCEDGGILRDIDTREALDALGPAPS